MTRHALTLWCFLCFGSLLILRCSAPTTHQETSTESSAKEGHIFDAGQDPDQKPGTERQNPEPQAKEQVRRESPIPDHGRQPSDLAPWEGLSPEFRYPPDHMWGKPGRGFMQRIVSFTPAKGASYGHDDFPKRIQGPPQGLGKEKGSFHVVSLGCGGSLVLEFSKPLIADGPGPDFIIFENAFGPSDDDSFSEPAQVSVSIDGKRWYSYPCQPSKSTWPYPKCAGVRPVFANSQANKISPYDVDKAGGDTFDLADLKLPYARFIKIEDRSRLLPDAAKWCNGPKAGFDLDAIAVRWGYQPR